jgi:beta-lactam-binding protein with PASTA domain
MNKKRKTKNLIGKLLDMPVYVNILVVFAVFCLIIYFVLKGIDVYTNHNKAVIVPNVIKLQIENAAPFFEKNKLKYVIVDSIYSKDVPPGAIVELMPEANSKVKKNRTIYVTVNAKTEQTIAVPDVSDMSFRQAFALLKSRGFMEVEWKYVAGAYRDLTIGIQYGGQIIKEGTRVPLTSKLILVISDGYQSIEQDSDSIETAAEEIKGDESWF